VRLSVLSLFAAFALVACGEDDVTGEWRDSAGRTLASYSGPEHCDWESVTFLEVAFSLARPDDELEPRSQYVRDPHGVLEAHVVAPYDGDAALPADAVATGFRRGEAELWVSPADADGDTYSAVYVVDGAVERWPRTRDEVACA
jgi:hypothetical protein